MSIVNIPAMRLRLAAVLLASAVAAADAPHLANGLPPAGRVPVDKAIKTAVEFLVKNQNKNGSFGTRTVARTYELWCHVPGGHQAFQGATTALCWMGLNDSPHQTEASQKAQAKCLAWLVKNVNVKRPYLQQFYNTWALGYGARALSQALQKGAKGATPDEIRKTLRALVKSARLYQTPDGGWGYLDFDNPLRKPTWSTPFTTATVLIGLYDAREAGIKVPQKVFDRAERLMWRLRTPDGNYAYSIDWKWRPKGSINLAQGSSMRNQACNAILHRLHPERCDRAQLRRGLDQIVKHHRFGIAALRRPRPHESHYAVSGYFYLYGQQYAGLVLDHLSDNDRRLYWPKLVEFVLKSRQPDGSFWDYPTYGYHKFYGTGYALITLARCPAGIAKTINRKKDSAGKAKPSK